MGSPASVGEVFLVFLRLGCTSFGGPVAHLGYYERELVERRRWCTAGTFGEVVALAQTLPGPASSQVGYTMGILRAGLAGGLAAWVGFTLPSACLMLAAAMVSANSAWMATGATRGLLHGLQLVAVAVVAQAVVSMRRTLAPDWVRMALAAAAAGLVLGLPGQWVTLAVIGLGAGAGLVLFRGEAGAAVDEVKLRVSRRAGVAAGVGFFLLLGLGLAVLVVGNQAPQWVRVMAAFVRSGALVFGGGHVVLPLLEGAVVAPGWVAQPVFLSGYGVAQALPGPLFTFAAYLGASVGGAQWPVLYGVMGLLGIFAPGLLAVTAVLPFWSALRRNGRVRAALKGMNAVVVGVLLAALISPLCTTTVKGVWDVVVAAGAFGLLVVGKTPAWGVVVLVGAGSLVMGMVAG